MDPSKRSICGLADIILCWWLKGIVWILSRNDHICTSEMWAMRRFRSACEFVQPRMLNFFMRATKTDAQADWSLFWTHISEGTFSHVTAHKIQFMMDFILTSPGMVTVGACALIIGACFFPAKESLRVMHYKNRPIQIYRKFHLQKLKIFR